LSIFDTTAPTDFNSFNQPVNAFNMGQEGWGMDRAYATPSFMAPYRPPYGGPGAGVYHPNPGFFRSVFGLSPANFSNVPYGVAAEDQERAYWDTIGTKPQDFMMASAQRIAVPVAAYGAAFALAKHWQVTARRGPEFTAARWMEGVQEGTAFTTSGFANAGMRFGGSAMRGLVGGAFGQAATRSTLGATAIGVGGALGGLAGALGGPLLLAQAGITLADKMAFENYNAIREGQNLFRRGFQGVTMGTSGGDVITGQGFSRRQASDMSTELTKFGNKDQVFTARDMNTITNMSAQMGLLDNVRGDQVTQRMKSIANQLKLVMSVAETTDFKEAIQMMAKLQSAGVGANNLGSTLAGISSFASQAGVSTRRLMNTVGAQGQFLFQSNGLTPAVGIATAANAMAGFSSAFRNGLISNDLMARMGGVEGATQASMTGQLNAAQTPYNMIRGFNKYVSGLGGNGVTSQVTNFGIATASNPIEAYGALIRTGRATTSQMLEDEGPLATYRQMRDTANLIVGNRKLSQNEMTAFLMPMMGNDQNAVQAFLTQMGTHQDESAMGLRRAGTRSARIRQMQDYMQQTEQTTFGEIYGGAMTPVRKAMSAVSGKIGSAVGMAGSVTDFFHDIYTQGNYGDISGLAGAGYNELIAGGDKTQQVMVPKVSTMAGLARGVGSIAEGMAENLPGIGTAITVASRLARGTDAVQRGEHEDTVAKLLRAHRSGDSTATKALSGDAAAIQQAAYKGLIDDRYKNRASIDNLSAVINSLPKEEAEASGLIGQFKKNLNSGVFGKYGKDEIDRARMYSLSADLAGADFNNLSDKQKSSLMELQGLTGETDVTKLKNLIEDKAVKEADRIGVDTSATWKRQNAAETVDDVMKRENPHIRAATSGGTRTTEQAGQHLASEGQVNRQERRDEQIYKTLMNEGKIDLATSYKMAGSVDKFDQAVDKFVKGVGKDVTPQSDTGPMAEWNWDSAKRMGAGIVNKFIKGG
jgi:hypothetical protein